MVKKCKGCKACHKKPEVLEKFEETNVDFAKIASYLGGTITEKEGVYEIHLGKENAGIKINGRDGKGLIYVVVMKSKKLFVSAHMISGVEKVRFSTVFAPRGKTKREVKDVAFKNKTGGIVVLKEGNKYTVVSSCFASANIKEE